MSFGLSPAVSIKETDLSVTIPNLPTAKTGFVLRTSTGPCMQIQPVASEADLVATFGKPSKTNYLDWFNLYNFLNYSSSAYVVRPCRTDVKNAGVSASGASVTVGYNLGNLYNPTLAETTLSDSRLFGSDRLYFFNKNVTDNQDIAVAVCSSELFWHGQLAGEFIAKIELKDSILGPDDHIKLSDSKTFEVLPGFSLVGGSQFIGTTGKLYTVKSVVKDSVVGYKAILDRDMEERDVAKFYGTVTAFTPIDNSKGAISFSTTLFNVDPSARFYVQTDDASDTEFAEIVVTSVSESNGNMVCMYETTNGAATLGALKITVGDVLTSNSNFYQGSISSEYIFNGELTDPNNGKYIIPAGTQVVKMLPGFTYEQGSLIDFNGQNYVVSEVDHSLNLIHLLTKVGMQDVSAPEDAVLTLPDVTTMVKYNPTITAVNKYNTIFDSSLIRREKVEVIDINGEQDYIYKESLVRFDQMFDFEPNWLAGEFVVLVLQKNIQGVFEVVESKLASYLETGKDFNGKNIFADDVFFYGSKYVYAKVGMENETAVETGDLPLIRFVGNAETDPGTVTRGQVMQAQDLFADSEAFDINILVAHQMDINGMSEIAENRHDCVAIIAPYDAEELSTVSATEATRILCNKYGTQQKSDEKLFTSFGTYSAVYGNMKYQYDKYNDVNRWVCIAGDIAGLYAQTDGDKDPWWAPAGLERGKIKNVIKLAFNPNKGNRDDLYVNAINPIMSVTGEGAGIVWGQKTATAKPSALDRVNVRRLMIVIEKAIASACRYTIFNFNDAFERTRVKGMIDPYLKMVQGRRGIYDFLVVCDETNNTPEILDQNGMVVDCFLKPTKVAEFIQVNAIITKSGADFSELVGGQK